MRSIFRKIGSIFSFPVGTKHKWADGTYVKGSDHKWHRERLGEFATEHLKAQKVKVEDPEVIEDFKIGAVEYVDFLVEQNINPASPQSSDLMHQYWEQHFGDKDWADDDDYWAWAEMVHEIAKKFHAHIKIEGKKEHKERNKVASRYTFKKSILTPLTVSEFKEHAGTKMVGIGNKRRLVVRRILADAMNRHSTVGATAQRLSEQANTPKGKDKRDWVRVVQTEYTDAKAKASIDLIRAVFGDEASVHRPPNPSCCDECSKLLKGKKFKVGAIPEPLQGAIHPNCVCPPWQTVERPDLTKAMDPLADVPMGVVKRLPDGKGWRAEISTGTGYWVPMDSATGRSVMRVVLMSTPAVLVGRARGFTLMAHGRWPTKEQFALYDLRKIGSARFYPYNLDHLDEEQDLRVGGMTKIHDLSQYMDKVRAALPTVACMPEYWDGGAGWRYLTDFLGYKTLTDWFIVVPGEAPLGSLLGRFSPGQISQRRAVRSYTQWALRQGDLKK